MYLDTVIQYAAFGFSQQINQETSQNIVKLKSAIFTKQRILRHDFTCQDPTDEVKNLINS
jgi:hypothetical protein